MLRLIGLAISIGFADSLNPSTIAPALYLAASGKHARAQVSEFTFGVFAVYFLGGLIVLLGPGELLLDLVPHPGRHLSYILETVAGVAMLSAAAFLWGYRKQLAKRDPPEFKRDGKSSAILGATITAVELPTAFPYFATIAAIVGSGLDVVRQIMVLLIFNLCFIAPLLGIIATLAFAGPNAQQVLTSGRKKLETHWPAVLAVLALVAGVFVTILGITGLASLHRSHFGSALGQFRRFLKP
jgi:cytochrome c biogenesis protein CcdA